MSTIIWNSRRWQYKWENRKKILISTSSHRGTMSNRKMFNNLTTKIVKYNLKENNVAHNKGLSGEERGGEVEAVVEEEEEVVVEAGLPLLPINN